jgi:hypothetical protein
MSEPCERMGALWTTEGSPRWSHIIIQMKQQTASTRLTQEVPSCESECPPHERYECLECGRVGGFAFGGGVERTS